MATTNLPPGVTEALFPGDQREAVEWGIFWKKVNKDIRCMGMTPEEAMRLWAALVLFYNDPVFEENGIWWFCKKDWRDVAGPFACGEDAQEALKKYRESLTQQRMDPNPTQLNPVPKSWLEEQRAIVDDLFIDASPGVYDDEETN